VSLKFGALRVAVEHWLRRNFCINNGAGQFIGITDT